MKVLSLFSGIGAFEKALDKLCVPYQMVAFCEIDKYASRSYSAIHGIPESMNLGDITKVDEKTLPKDIVLITYGFPCQDISLAGKQKGLFNADGAQTRSGLCFEALRIIEEAQPKFAIAENVKNLTSKKFAVQFKIVLDSLKAAGYNNYWKVLNAKDYGIPQNRERVFIVSIRKDIDAGLFEFPEPFPLSKRLKDILDDEVDEKYYLSDEQTKRLTGNVFTQDNLRLQKKDWCDTLLARDYKDPKCVSVNPVRIGNIYGDHCGTGYAGNVWDKEAISPALMTMGGGNRQPLVIVSETTKKGFPEAFEGDTVSLERPNSKTRRGRGGKQVEVSDREYANALTTVQKDPLVKEPSLRIRKLTPKECWRLMGFDDTDFEKAEAVNSNTQLYKQAGNSIVVPVIQHILENLIKAVKDCL